MSETELEGLLSRMSLEEQVSLLSGADFWTTVGIARLGVPSIQVTDGPNGARGGGGLVGGDKAVCFPSGISLAATWNPTLAEEVGEALAQEARARGARVLLAPTVNLHRSTLNGRNFECYSEDPLLSAEIAVGYVRGVQGGGVAATLKHFAGNESEFERMSIDVRMDERPLRELYLVPFEAAVKRAGAWAVMAAYNKVNGAFASENPHLLTDILKRQWGFDGVVMSDWFGSHSTVETMAGGLDLEMPGPTRDRGDKLVAAVRAGEVREEWVRESARRVLRLLSRVGAFSTSEAPRAKELTPSAFRALVRRAGAEGIVLLKNDGLLPLNRGASQRLALLGPNVREARIMGGGSAQLNAVHRVSPLEGITAALGDATRLEDAPGCTHHRLQPLLRERVSVEFFPGEALEGVAVHHSESAEGEVMWLGEVGPGIDPSRFSARLSATFTPREDGEHVFGLVSAGRARLFVDGALLLDAWTDWRPGVNYFGMGNDEARASLALEAGRAYRVVVEYASVTASIGIRAVRIGVARPLGEADLERAVELARRSDVALLFVGLSEEWDTEGQDRTHMELPGRQNELIARVAAVNPRTVVVLQTGAPVTMPWVDDVAAILQAWYPGQECGHAIADVLFGEASPGGRLPQSFPVRLEDHPAFGHYPGAHGRVDYAEGVFIGYRHYERAGLAPLFPFGHGLDYTDFTYANLRLDTERLEPGGMLTVTLDVTNRGGRAGSTVVQIYVRDETARVARPDKELKAFAKVALQPGETRSVSRTLDMRALAWFDETHACWLAEAGRFELLVGASSSDLRARATFELSADWRGAP